MAKLGEILVPLTVSVWRFNTGSKKLEQRMAPKKNRKLKLLNECTCVRSRWKLGAVVRQGAADPLLLKAGGPALHGRQAAHGRARLEPQVALLQALAQGDVQVVHGLHVVVQAARLLEALVAELKTWT